MKYLELLIQNNPRGGEGKYLIDRLFLFVGGRGAKLFAGTAGLRYILINLFGNVWNIYIKYCELVHHKSSI